MKTDKLLVALLSVLLVLGFPGASAYSLEEIQVPAAGVMAGFASAVREVKTSPGSVGQAYVLNNGVTAPIYDYKAAIRESVWVEAKDWPRREHEMRLSPRADGRLALGPGSKGALSWVNKPTQTEATAVTAGENLNRLLFTTGLLTRDLRITGAPELELEINHDAVGGVGQVGLELVDYGDAERVLSEGEGVSTAATQSCWGDDWSDIDDACYFDVVRRMGHTPLQVLSRGWARLDTPGTHRLTIEMVSNDIIVPAGHQLGLVLVAASPEWVVTIDAAPTTYTLNLRGSLLRIPIVGPVADFRPGKSKVPPQRMLTRGSLPKPQTATRIPD